LPSFYHFVIRRTTTYCAKLTISNSAGNIVYLPHYLDETRASFTEPWIIRKDFDEWVETG
jgi:hypothetical protein